MRRHVIVSGLVLLGSLMIVEAGITQNPAAIPISPGGGSSPQTPGIGAPTIQPLCTNCGITPPSIYLYAPTPPIPYGTQYPYTEIEFCKGSWALDQTTELIKLNNV